MASRKHPIKNYLCIAGLAWLTAPCFSQSLLQSRQFHFDPYLFNVAYTGEAGKTHALLYYRQQWLQIKDGPANFGFNIQHPLTQKMAFGFSFNSTTTVALHNDDLLGSFAYQVAWREKQSLRFGISGGLGMYRLDLGNADFSNDPAVLSSAANRSYIIGNFGMLYTLGKLKVGASLPDLFGKNHLTRSDNNRQLLNQLYSVSFDYHIPSLSDDFRFTNYVLYRFSYDYQNFWEGALMAKWKTVMEAGINYRQYSGLGFLLGVRPTPSLRFSYSFEPSPTSGRFVATSSHEFHFDLNFIEIMKKLKPAPNQAD